MPEKPILFSAPMIRAILAGTKTVTRRVVKLPDTHEGWHLASSTFDEAVTFADDPTWDQVCARHDVKVPYVPGDRLWVRETWQAWRQCSVEYDEWEPITSDYRRELGCPTWREFLKEHAPPDAIEYKATSDSAGPWTTPIHMPRWASRLTLEVESVRVERLQEATPADVLAEGVPMSTATGLVSELDFKDEGPSLVERWIELWNAINAKRGHSWESNPWVWVVGFRRIEQGEQAA